MDREIDLNGQENAAEFIAAESRITLPKLGF
jgi:hypothetical protein